jgi:hypothetical protein
MEASGQLDFSRCDDGATCCCDERRKLDARGAPARVEERAAERRLPGDVPDEVKGGRIERLLLSDGDGFAFTTGNDRLESEIPFEYAMTPCVDVTRGRADLGVGVRGKVLNDEVDQPALALEQGKHLDCTIHRLRHDGVRRRLCVRVNLKRVGQATFDQDGKKCRKCQLDPSPSSHRNLQPFDCDTRASHSA